MLHNLVNVVMHNLVNVVLIDKYLISVYKEFANLLIVTY